MASALIVRGCYPLPVGGGGDESMNTLHCHPSTRPSGRRLAARCSCVSGNTRADDRERGRERDKERNTACRRPDGSQPSATHDQPLDTEWFVALDEFLFLSYDRQR